MGFKLAKGRLLVIFAVIIAVPLVSNWSGIQTYIHTKPVSVSAKLDINIADLLKYTNENRQIPLALDERLNRSAQAKCEDMVAKDYWAHIAPDGTTPWVFVQHEGVHYQFAGENLSENIFTSAGVITAWMNSPEHKKNIIDPNFSEVGFGICHSDSYIGNKGASTTIVVQHFAG